MREFGGPIPRAAAVAALLACGCAWAGPQGGQIAAGAGAIEQASTTATLVNQYSQSLAINWSSFNVAAGESVQFVQPNASAVVLNRILDVNPSTIFGRIEANGTVFLVNTRGVVFGETAELNVGSLVVSGLDISVDDFMAGRYNLAADGAPGFVINHGIINAASGGSVVLVGGQVVNTGLISAKYGRVSLAGAAKAYLDFDGDGLIRVEVTGSLQQKLDKDDAAVANHGTIRGGQVVMEAAAAKGLFDNLVNNDGVIVASAIDTSGGQVRLVADGGNAVNSGTIDASSVTGDGGSVTLTAKDGNVVNSGTIDVSSVAGKAGTVTLAATSGDVVNSGVILANSALADGGIVQVVATGGDIADTGTIEARSVEADGGSVRLESDGRTVVDGAIIDTGSDHGIGGEIAVLGHEVVVSGPSRLGSSGGLGGGVVLVGGDFRGANPLVRNASRTYFGPDATIDVSAIDSGSAGRVIVWSEDVTWFYGTVSARGPPSGTGGFTEVSSHGYLAFSGLVDLRGGTNGTLLLDPTDILICSSGGGCGGSSNFTPGSTFQDTNNNGPSPSTLLVSDLQTQLNLGNVIVTTASSFSDAGNITVQDPITWSSANSLTLTANNSISVNATITASGSGSLTLNASGGSGITINAGITLGSGTLTLNADSLALGAALGGPGAVVIQPISTGTNISIGTGAAGGLQISDTELANITDGHNAVTIGSASGSGTITITAATFSDPVTIRSSSGAIAVNGAITGTGNASVTLDTGGTTTLSAGITTADQAITIAHNVVIGEGLGVVLDTASTGAGAIAIGGTLDGTAGGAAESLTLNSGSGAITVTGAVGVTTPLDVTLQSDTAGSTGTATFSGALNVLSLTTFARGYAVILNGGGTITAAATFANTAGVTLGNDAADAFTFDGGLTSTASATSLAGTVATSNDAITLGSPTLTANTTLNAGTATVTLAGLTGSTFNLTVTADEIELTGAADSVVGSGTLTLQPFTASQAVDIAGAGGTGALDLTAAEIATIKDGFTGIVIGNAAGTGGLTIGAITFKDPVTLRSPSGGTLAVNGTLTGTGNASITLDGAGATTVLSADIVTADQDITISDSVRVAEGASVKLDTGTGGGGNISITGTTDGTAGGVDETLQLISGSGTITLTGAVGGTTPLALVLQSDVAGNTGAVTFNGAVTALSLQTFARGYSVALNGGGTITAAVSFLNTAGVTLGNDAADVLTFNGGVSSTASTATLAGTVATSDDAITLGAVTLAANATLDTAAATTAGDITLGAVTGGGFSLTLKTGAAIAGADVSGTSVTGVNALTLQNVGGSASFSGALSAASLTVDNTVVNFASTGSGGAITNAVAFTNTGTLTLGQGGGTQTYNGGLTTSGAGGTVTLNGSIVSSDDAIVLGAVTLGSNVTLNTNATATNTADLTLGAVTGGSNNLTLATGAGVANADVTGTSVTAGTLTLQNVGGTASFTGTLTLAGLAAGGTVNGVSLTGTGSTVTGAVAFANTGALTLGQAGGTQTYNGGLATTAVGGTVTLNGSIVTSDDAITLGAVTLGSDVTLNTSATATNTADITLGTVTGGANSLTLATGAVANANVTGTGVTANGLTLQTIGGTASFTGTLTLTSLTVGGTVAAVSLTGSGNTITNAVAFANTGALTLGQAGGTQTYAGGLSTSGVGGTVTLNGTIQTTNSALTLATATLGSAVTLSAGTGTVTTSGITGGSNSLTITADEISLSGSPGSIAGTGAITLQPFTTTQAVNVAGADSTLGTTLDLTSAELSTIADGHSSITIGSATGTGLVTVSTVTFSDPVTIRAGGATGDITVAGAITTTGSTSITLSAGRDVALGANLTTAAQTTGTAGADTNVSGSITISAGGSISGAGVLTTGNASADGVGADTATSGSIALTAGGAVQLSGADALKTGNASITTATGNDTATAGSITVSGAKLSSDGGSGKVDVSLGTASGGNTNNASTIAVTSTGGAGDAGGIFLSSDQALRLGALVTGAGAQNVSIATTTNVGLTLNSAAESLADDAVTLDAGSGLLTFSDTSFNVGAGSLTLIANTITLTTTAGAISGSGTVVLKPDAVGTTIGIAGGAGTFSLSTGEIGAFANGFSSITIGRSDSTALLTVGAAVTFNDPVTLLAGSMTFSATLTGTESVTLTAGSGGIADGPTNNTSKVTAPTITITAAGDLGGSASQAEFDVAGVTVLSVNVDGSIYLRGDAATKLTDLTVEVSPAGTDTYNIVNFIGLTWGTALSDTGTDVKVDGITWSDGTASTVPLNVTIVAETGNLLLNDNSDGGGGNKIAISLGADGGNITLTATAGDILDNDTGNSDATITSTGTANLVTTSTSAIVLTAGGNDVGTSAGNGDIDVSGTGAITCNATNCYVSTDTSLSALTLAGDPQATAGEDINIHISGASGSVDVDESCSTGNSCITANLTLSGFDMSYTGLSGDIYIISPGITLNGGDLTLTANAGSIYEFTNNTTTDISTTGAVILSAANGIGTLASPVDLALSTLAAHVTGTGGIYLNELDSITLQAIDTVSGAIAISAGTSILDDASNATTISGTSVSLTAGTAIGASGNEIDTNTTALALSAGTSFFVANAADLADLTITSVQSGDANTYSLSATNLTFTVTDAGSNYLLTNVTDTTGINFTFNGDESISVGTIGAGAGSVTLSSSAGSIVDDANDSTADITGGTVTLTAATGVGESAGNGSLDTAAGSLDISVTGAGLVNLAEADAVTLTAIDTANGAITISAGGLLTVTNVASTTDADANDITLTGVGIALGVVNAGGTAGDVTLNAGTGAITDGNATTTNVTADALSATAAGGLEFDTVANTLTTNTSGSNGNQVIRESGGLTDVSLNAGTGDISLSAGGAVAEAAGSITAGGLALLGASASYTLNSASNNVATIAANTGALSYVDSNSLTVGTVAGTIGITSSGALSLTAGGNDSTLTITNPVAATGATLTADKMAINAAIGVGSGSVTLAPESITDAGDAINLGSAVDTNANTLELSDAELDNITAGTLTIGNGSAGAITVSAPIDLTDGPTVGALALVSGGALTDANGTGADLTVASLSITAASVGVGDALETSVDSLAIDTSAANGDQLINEANGLTDLALDAGTGNVTLVLALGGIADTAVDGTDITATSASLTLSDATAQDIGASGNRIETSVGSLSGSTAAGNGSQYFTEANGLTDLVLDAGTGDVVLALSAGAIADTAADGVDVTATHATLTSGSGIGAAGNAIELSANYITATSGSGDIVLTNNSTGDTNNAHLAPYQPGLGAVEITNLATTGGNITFDQTGGASLLVLSASTTTSGDITLTDSAGGGGGMALMSVSAAGAVSATMTGGGMAVDSVTAGTSVTLSATDNIGENDVIDGGTIDAGADITAPTVTLTADNGIGQSLEALEISTDTLVTDTSAGNADQFLAEINGLSALQMNAGSGAVSLTLLEGALADTDGSTDITAGSATIVLADANDDGDDFGSLANPVGTAVDSLAVDTGADAVAGDQYIDETDGLTDLDLDAGSGTVRLTTGGSVLSADAAVDLIAAQAVIVVTSGDFGDTDTAAGNAIETTVADLSVDTAATNGSQFIRETDGLSELDLNAGTGDIQLRTGGAVASSDLLADVQANRLFVTVGSGDFGDTDTAAGNAIETAVTELTVDTSGGNGSQFIRESDGLAEINLNAGSGDIYFNAGASVLSADLAVDVVADQFVATLNAGSFGDTSTASGDAIETSVNGLDVDTSAGNGSQFLRESDGLTELTLNAGSGSLSLRLVDGAVADTDGAADLVGLTATVVLADANDSGDSFGSLANPIGTSVDALVVDTAAGAVDGSQYIVESNGLTDLDLAAGSGAVRLVATLGSILDTSADGTDVSAATIDLETPAGVIGASGGQVDLAGVTNLTLKVLNGFYVAGDGVTNLTDLAVTLDSSSGGGSSSTYVLTGFPNVPDWGTGARGLYDACCIGGTEVTIYNISASTALNLSITNIAGDIYLTDASATGAAAISLPAGNITVTASSGAILDYNPVNLGAPSDDSPATDYNLRTDGASTVSLNAPGNSIGGAGDADIDVSGTGNLAINAASSNVATDVALTSLSLTFDPVGDAVSFSLSGATTVSIDEACLSGNVCINQVTNSGVDFDFSLTATTGNILLADFAISGINDSNVLNGTGSVTLVADAGGIFRQTPGSLNYNIATDGPISLTGAGGSVTLGAVTQTGAVGSITDSNNPITVSGYFNPYTLQLGRTGDGEINVRGVNGWAMNLTGFSSTGAGETDLTSTGNLTVNTDLIQSGSILLTSPSNSLSISGQRIVESTLGNVSLVAGQNLTLATGASGSQTQVIADAGKILLSAQAGTLSIGDFVSVSSGAASADAVTLRSTSLAIDTTGNTDITATASGGGIRLFTYAGGTSMEIGGACASGGYCVSDAELARLTNFDVLTLGESGVQTAQVALITVAMPVADGALIVNGNGAGGRIVLDDEGAANGAALSGTTGPVTLNAGSGGITANVSGTTAEDAEIDIAGTVTLNSVGAIGTATNRIQFAAGQDDVNAAVTGASNGISLGGLGDLTLAAITTNGGALDVLLPAGFTLTGGGAVSTGSGAITLTSDEIDLTGSLAGTGTLTLQPVTPTLAIDIGSASDVLGSLSVTDADIANLADGFAAIVIGRSNGSHVITLVDATFTDPVTLRAPAGAGAVADDVADSTTDFTGGALTISVGTGGVGQGAGGSIDTEIANLDVASAGAVSVNEATSVAIGAITASGQAVTLVAGGALTDGNAATTNVTASSLNATAVTGIDLDTAIAQLTASNSTSGGINIADTDGFLVNTVSAAGQTVTLNGGTGAIGDNNGIASNITAMVLDATAATGINLDTTISTLKASNSTSGGIDIADADGFTVDTVSAPGTQTVTLNGGSGGIDDDAADTTTDITAQTVNLVASTGLGAVADLDLAATNINASSAAGNVALNNSLASGNVQLDVATTAGSITFAQSGGASVFVNNAVTTTSGDITVTAANPTGGIGAFFVDSAGAVTVTTSGSGEILVADVTAATSVTLTSAANINDDYLNFAGGTDASADIVAASVSLSAATGIGDQAQIQFTAPAISAVTTNGDIDLASLATAPVVASSLSTGTGSITFAQSGGQALTVNSATATAGAITISNAGANLTVVNASNGGAGSVPLSLTTTTAGDVILGSLTSGDTVIVTAAGDVNTGAISATNNVVLSAGGAVTDANGATTNVTATNLDITAVTGISLDTAVTHVAASNSTSGNVDLADTDGFAISLISAPGQTVTLNGGTGAITDYNGAGVNNVSATLLDATAATGITLDTAISQLTASNSTSGGINIADTDGFAVNTVSAAGQTVTLNGGTGAITDNNAAATNVTATLLNATAATGIDLDTTISTLTASNATSGGINIADTDGFAVNTVSAAGQTVTLNGGTGAISDNNAAATNVTATLLDVTATTGIDLDTAISTLTASNSTSGGINIADTNGLALNLVSAPGTQTVTLNGGTGAITDNNGVSANVVADTLSITSATGIDIDTTVASLGGSTSGAGNVRFDETDGLTVTSFTVNNGSFTLTTGGATTLTSIVSTTSSDANDIAVTASTGDVAVGTVNAGAGGGDVTLTATAGAITSATSAVTGDVVTLNAQSGVGASGSRINTAAATLDVAVTGAGAVWLNEADGVTLDSITTANGLIDIQTGGNTTITNTGVISSTDSDANDILIVASAGDILVGLVDTDVANNGALGDVTITASAGSVNDLDANPDTTLDIRGDVVTVSGATGAGNVADLDIDASSVSVSGGSGGVGVNDLNGGDVVLTLSSAGNISYGTNGNILVDSVTSTGGDVTLTSFSGYIADAFDDTTLDISGATVTLTAPNGVGGNGLVPVTGLAVVDSTGGVGALEVSSTTLNVHTTSTSAAPVVIRDIGGTTLGDLDTVNGDITVVSDGALVVGDIDAGTTTLSDVTLNAAGGTLTTSGPGITADALTAAASTGITLTTGVNSLTASVSGVGSIAVTEADAIDLVSVSTTDGPITVSAGGAITATSVTANDADNTGDGDISLSTSAGDITVGSVNANDDATLAAAAALVDGTTGDLTVGGLATLSGSSITLGNDAGNADAFGTLTFNSAGAVSIAEDDATTLTGSSTAASLVLSSGGALTDDATADLAVTGNASFAGSSIDLGDVGTAGNNDSFGTLTFNSAGAVSIVEDDATDLAGASTADSLVLASAGALADGTDGDLTVTNNAALSGSSITLGNDAGNATDFGTLTFTSAGAVSIAEDSDTVLAGASSALSLALGSAATITDGTDGDLAITNNATFSGTSITLGNDAGNADAFGTLTFNSAGAVSIAEDDATTLTGSSTAASLVLSSGGALTDDATADLAVTGNASFAGSSIDLGDVGTAGNNDTFGTLTFNSAGAVSIVEDDATDLAGASTADSLVLASAGALADGTDGDLTVTNNVALSGSSITLGNDAGNADAFGTLTFTSAGAVSIAEDDATTLAGSSTAGSLVLASAGALTDGTDGDMAVTGNATLSGASITLGNDSGNDTNFGTLTFSSAGAVSVSEDSATQLTGASSADSLTLASAGAITQATGSSLAVANLSTLTATGNDITLAEAGNDFGTVTVTSANNVTLVDANDLVLGSATVNNLTVTAGGALTDAGNLGVVGLATLSGASIDIGGGAETTNFGTLMFTSSGSVAISEDGNVDLSGNSSAGTLTLTSETGSIADGATATLGATDATFAAAGAITLDNANSFGTVSVTSASAVTLATGALDTDGLVLGAIATAGNLAVTTAAGDITSSGALAIGGNSSFTADGAGASIVVDDPANDFTGNVTFGGAGLTNVTIVDTTALDLAGANLTGDLSVTAPTITASGPLVIGGIASFDLVSGNDLGLTNAGNDFATVVVTNANNVTLVDSNGIDLGDMAIGGDLSIAAGGNITDSGVVIVTGATTLDAGAGSIDLTDAGNDFGGPVTVTSTGGVALLDANSLTLNSSGGAIALTGTGTSGTLTINSTGALSTSALSTTTPNGAYTVAVNATDVAVDGVFDAGDDALFVTVTGSITGSADGSLSADQITLHADGPCCSNSPAMGDTLNPIVIIIDDPSQFHATVGVTDHGPGFGFIRGDNFGTADFQRVYEESNHQVIVIGNFAEIVSSVQGSFITAPSFNVDSSQFRTDLNIFGVEGAGLLLPVGQCEDEESPDCAR